MKITAKTDCAIRALVQLAIENERVSVKSIAEKQNLSVRYLEQVIAVLKKNNLVSGLKGPTGGYTLIGKPSEITLHQIITAVEVETQFSSESSEDNLDEILKGIWYDIDQHIEEKLSQITLKDILIKIKNKSNEYMYYI
ncbi:MAG: Rrf2 family transcriptional regulator [Clostridia bacterium]|nr:Rrf2 family transcriptional regulator [Clostridia bacterium]